MTDKTSSYLSLEQLKNSLEVDSDRHDSKLLDILQESRSEIDMRIKRYVDDVPLPPGNDVYVMASKCALLYARARWYEHQFQLEKAKFNDELFEKRMERLTESIVSDKPGRTEAIYITKKEPLKDRVFLTSEIDHYLAQEFI